MDPDTWAPVTESVGNLLSAKLNVIIGILTSILVSGILVSLTYLLEQFNVYCTVKSVELKALKSKPSKIQEN